MRVFVAGGTGAVGRPLVQRLLEAGHEVVVLVRSDAGAASVRAVGAEPTLGDALDRESVARSVMSARPEVVVHQLTALPKRIDPRKPDRDLATTNRLRVEATDHLLSAAAKASARRFIAQSIAFQYEPGGDDLRTEDDPVDPDPPSNFARSMRAIGALEERTLGSDGVEGVVLRYGSFYGPGTYYATDGSICEDIRRRRFPIVGTGDGVTSFIHVADAASAAVAALDGGPAGVSNVVDDEPAPARQWLPYFADLLGAPPPRRVPVWAARLFAGPYVHYLAVRAPGVSNAKAKRELGWSPRWSSWRDGLRAELAR